MLASPIAKVMVRFVVVNSIYMVPALVETVGTSLRIETFYLTLNKSYMTPVIVSSIMLALLVLAVAGIITGVVTVTKFLFDNREDDDLFS